MRRTYDSNMRPGGEIKRMRMSSAPTGPTSVREKVLDMYRRKQWVTDLNGLSRRRAIRPDNMKLLDKEYVDATSMTPVYSTAGDNFLISELPVYLTSELRPDGTITQLHHPQSINRYIDSRIQAGDYAPKMLTDSSRPLDPTQVRFLHKRLRDTLPSLPTDGLSLEELDAVRNYKERPRFRRITVTPFRTADTVTGQEIQVGWSPATAFPGPPRNDYELGAFQRYKENGKLFPIRNPHSLLDPRYPWNSYERA